MHITKESGREQVDLRYSTQISIHSLANYRLPSAVFDPTARSQKASRAAPLPSCALAMAASLAPSASALAPWRSPYDGANIWVTNNGVGTVTKLRASDGEVLGTFNAGRRPGGIAFDGYNIWVANFYGSSVTKLQASDGAILDTFPV